MIKFRNEDIKYLALELPYVVKYTKHLGNFYAEISDIDDFLERDMPRGMRMRLIIEREIAKRLNEDYLIRFDELFARVGEKYPAITVERLCEIIRMGHVDYIKKGEHGLLYFQNSAAENIFACHKRELMSLSDPCAQPDYHMDDIRAENFRVMREKGSLAYRFEVEESIAPRASALRAGEKLRIHLPYPAPCDSQPKDDIKLILSSHKDIYISNASQRTVSAETFGGGEDKLCVRFSYINRAAYVEVDPDAVSANQPSFYTDELLPHIRFTPLICSLAEEIAGDEKNPYKLARRVYDWVTRNVKYSYMREYFCIDNLVEFALLNGRGDCGIMALLFITLCRRLGIPACWESGWSVRDVVGSHDWARFYIAPYGWLYADPSYGGGALRRGREDIWNHYFCNLDPFRMVANTDFQGSFDPPKEFMRIDPYDNQSGEAEYENYGLSARELDRERRVISVEEI